MSKLLEILSRYASTINAMEQAAFAHDFDKSSEEFLQNADWHAQKKYKGDDSKRITERSERFREMGLEDREIPNPDLLFSEIFQKEVSISGAGNYSSPFIEHHRNNPTIPFSLAGAILNGGICGADGIDSALDKEGLNSKYLEKQTLPFWIATPFEKKERQWNNSKFPTARDIWNCGGRIRECREALSDMLGETRKPMNDVTLYAHSYHAATFAKAIMAKILMEYHSGIRNSNGKYELPTRAEENTLQLCYLDCIKVEFDIDYLFSRSHTAGDLRGAVAELNMMMTDIRNFFESKLLCGNELYRDHYRLLFVIPRLESSLDGEWRRELRSALESQVVELLRKHRLEELPFLVAFNTQETKPLYTLDKGLIEFSRELLTGEHDFCRQDPVLLKSLEPQSGAGRVCDVCSMRLAETSTGANSDWLCPVCSGRRQSGMAGRSERRMPELEELVPGEENKLVYLSVQVNLSSLRDGSLWKDRPQYPSPGRIARSYETLEKFHREFLGTELPFHTPNGSFSLLQSPERLDVIFAASSGDRVLRVFLEKYQEEFGSYAEKLMPKIGMVYFHRNYPFYAVWDTMKRMMKQLSYGCWDFMLLDAPDDRFGFSRGSRKHHIFGKAPKKRLADFGNYPGLYDLLTRLTKSQISNIEGELIRLFLDWDDRCRKDERTFRKMCALSLFAPNAFGSGVSAGEQAFLLNSAVSGELLDVIDLYIHLENKKTEIK